MRVIFLGLEASYSHLAAQKHFAEKATYTSSTSIRELFTSIMQEKDSYGVVPLENSLAGSVYPHYDLLLEFKPKIVAELLLPIQHQLLALPEAKEVEKVNKVFAHPQALAQCAEFLKVRPWIEAISYEDNASAAKMVALKKDVSFCAIAGSEAAKLYSLKILAGDIQDNTSNTTRFVVIAKKSDAVSSSRAKCSLIFELAHEPGSLLKVLQVLADYNANITKLESRAIKDRPFEYQFIVDFEVSTPEAELTIAHVRKVTSLCYVLGVYPANKIVALLNK